MKYYITMVRFTDNELVTITHKEAEEIKCYIEEMHDYLKEIVAIVKVEMKNGETTAEVLEANRAV